MSKLTSDPLLAAAKVILALGVALLIFVIAMVMIGLGAVLTVQRGEILALLAGAGASDSAYWTVVVALLLIGGLMFLALRFVLELRGIVHSVDKGDPFEPENANRLARMAWLTLGVQLGTVLVHALGYWLDQYTDEAHRLFSYDGGASLNGLVLALTLFILARVFRQGAAMREDLEGTV